MYIVLVYVPNINLKITIHLHSSHRIFTTLITSTSTSTSTTIYYYLLLLILLREKVFFLAITAPARRAIFLSCLLLFHLGGSRISEFQPHLWPPINEISHNPRHFLKVVSTGLYELLYNIGKGTNERLDQPPGVHFQILHECDVEITRSRWPHAFWICTSSCQHANRQLPRGGKLQIISAMSAWDTASRHTENSREFGGEWV